MRNDLTPELLAAHQNFLATPDKPNALNPVKTRLTIDTTISLDPLSMWRAAGFQFNPAQQQVLFDAPTDAPDLCLYQGGYGCGKTFAAAMFGLQQALSQPGTTGLILAKHADTLTEAVIAQYTHILTQLGLINGHDYVVRKANRRILFKNGSVIYLRTLRQHWQVINAHWAHAETVSDFTQPQLAELLSRLNEPGNPPRLVATTMPTPLRWVNALFSTHPCARKVIGKTADNHTLHTAYLSVLQATLPQDHWATQLNGQDLPANQWVETLKKPRKKSAAAQTTTKPDTHPPGDAFTVSLSPQFKPQDTPQGKYQGKPQFKTKKASTMYWV